ncbi:hypothetical protein BRD17_00880 [Halobacteriales archaeon SW_7_68_16]|nr:MAG: hypothetical protein BRD17_00880 [Halobacteriales archaeon SW_7_68_16]
MSRQRPIAVALAVLCLCLLAGVVGGVGTGIDSPSAPSTSGTAADAGRAAGSNDTGIGAGPLNDTHLAVTNITTRLDLPGDGSVREGIATPEPRLGTAVAVDDTELRARFGRYTVEERFETARTTPERRRIIGAELDRVAADAETIATEERAAVGRYVDGTTDHDDLARALGLTAAEADARRVRLDALRAGISTATPRARTRLEALDTQLAVFGDPVRDRVVEAVDGTIEPPTVRITASDAGTVLGTIGTRYRREAVRFNYRNGGEPQLETTLDADSRARAVYPWIGATPDAQITSVEGFPDAGLFRVTVVHPQGAVVTHLDSATTNPFRESQSLRLSDLPRRSAGTATNGSLRLAVDRTYPDGPVRVTVTEAGTGEPVQATISVDGRTVGSGTGWVLPPGGTYRVTATTVTESVSVRVDE